MHFAAQTHVCQSFGNPVEFTKSNVLGTHMLVEACNYYGKIKKFVHVSTDEVYGDIVEGSRDETSVLHPTNPYAATKAGAEHIVRSYGFSFKFPYVITRGNNVYGQHQCLCKVIPRFIAMLMKGKKMTIQGEGKAVRNFIHVKDTVSAFMTILDKGVLTETYNIASEDEISVMELAQILLKKLKPGENFNDWIIYTPDRNFNDSRYSITNAKLEALGWKRKVSFEEGLHETIDWYIKNPEIWEHYYQRFIGN